MRTLRIKSTEVTKLSTYVIVSSIYPYTMYKHKHKPATTAPCIIIICVCSCFGRARMLLTPAPGKTSPFWKGVRHAHGGRGYLSSGYDATGRRVSSDMFVRAGYARLVGMDMSRGAVDIWEEIGDNQICV